MGKIIHVTSSVSRDAGGLFFAMTSLLKELQNSGVEKYEVLGFKDDKTNEDLEAWGGVTCTAYDATGVKMLPMSTDMRRSLNDENIDLIHTHGLWQMPSSYVLRASKRRSIPYIVSPHGMLDKWALRNSNYKKRLIGFLYENNHLNDAKCIHALCYSEYEAIRDYGIKSPVCIIPNGVDLPEMRPVQNFRRSSSNNLLFVGRIHPKKGIAEAIMAWSKVVNSSWSFTVAGWDQLGHQLELEQLCSSLSVSYKRVSVDTYLNIEELDSGTVYFVGPAFGVEKEALFNRASAFILSSYSEGLPMSVLEAWSYALPVVMTEECNLPEGFEANASIKVVLDESQSSLIKGLNDLFLLSEEARSEMGRRGYELVKERFTWKVIAQNFRDVYMWLLGKGEQPDSIYLK